MDLFVFRRFFLVLVIHRMMLNDGSWKLKTGSNNAFFEVLTLIDLHFLFAR